MNDRTKENLNGKIEVPTWVMAITYVLCWSFAIALIAVQITGYVTYRPLLVALAVYLLLWPVFQITPAEMLRKVFPGSG